MPAITAIYNKLKQSTDLTDRLSTYDNGAVIPAIFTGGVPPVDTSLPCIVLSTLGASREGYDRVTRGGNVSIDINLWGDKDPSIKSLRDTSMIIWALLDRTRLVDSTDFEFPRCLCSMPKGLTDPDGFPGFILSVTVLMREI